MAHSTESETNADQAAEKNLGTLFLHILEAGRMAQEAESDFLRRHALNPHQLAILQRLHQTAGQTQHSFQLAEWTGVSRSGMTWQLDALEKKHLVTRTKDLQDRRAIAIALTDRGRAAVVEIEAGQRTWIREALDKLGERECRTLTRLLQKAQEGLGRGPEPDKVGLTRSREERKGEDGTIKGFF